MTTSDDAGEQVTLENQARLFVREIRKSDKAALAAAFAHLTSKSRRTRFHAAKTHLTDAELKFLTECDGHNHYALVAGHQDEESGEIQGVGVARFLRTDDDPAVAEIAITVADEWQGSGVGGILLQKLIDAAATRHIKTFRAIFSTDNTKMKNLAAHHLENATVKHDGNGMMILEYSIVAQGAFELMLQVFRKLTFGTMIVPFQLGEQTLRQVIGKSVANKKRKSR